MQKIIATIKKNEAGVAVANLQDALFAMMKHGYISPMPPRGHSSEKDLQKLAEKLKDEQAQSVYGESTTQLVFYFQLQNGLDDILKGQAVDKKTADMLNKFLAESGLLDQSDIFTVRGAVKDSNGMPQPDLTVIAFDKDLRKEQALGEAITDIHGNYRVEYTAEKFALAEGVADKPDLLVRVYGDKDKTTLIAESEIRFNAGKDEIFDFAIATRSISEWERITNAVLPLLERQKENGEPLPPNELTSTDIDFIVTNTGLDPEQLRLWVLAFSVALSMLEQTSSETEIMRAHISATHPSIDPAETARIYTIFYGWFRDGQPQNWVDLIKTSVDQLMASLKNAVTQNYIPELDEKQLIGIEAFIKQLKLKQVIKPAAEGEPASLGDVLNAMKADWLKDKLGHIVDLTTKISHKSDDFIEQAVSAGLNDTQALQLRQTLYLGDITQKNIPLIKVLQPMVADDKQGSLKGLASLTSSDWLNLAYEHGTESLGFISHAEYAENLQAAVEKLVPHEVLKTKLDADDIKFLPSNFANVKTVLAKHKDFNIIKSNIDQFAEDNKIDSKTTSALTKLQHLKRLNASWDEVSVLVNTRIDDAEEITNYGRDQFKTVLKDHLPEQRLDEIYRQAGALKAASIGLMGHMFPVLYGVSPAVMADRSLKSHQSQIDNNPTLRKIFGVLDQCVYDPCLSVLSPAAYLADLLKFIDGSPSARAELERRRPDIFDLELSCDNTKIELPQIDLAIEILENAIALPFNVVLPSHTDVKAELSDGKPVGNNTLQALQETSKEKLENLIATTNNSTWTVKDQYRTWSIESFEETLVFKRLAQTIPLDINKMVHADPVAELNSGNIPSGLESDVGAVLGDVIGLKLPLGQSDIDMIEILQLNPTSKSNLKKWKVNFTFEGEIYIDLQNNSLTISRLDGLDYTKNTTLNLLTEFKEDFDNHQITSVFIGYLNNITRTKKYRVNEFRVLPKDVDVWRFEYSGSIGLEYQPAEINITGLTYQSTAADRDLFARPQNTNPLAYKTIAAEDACFPWSLPYNRALNETRETLTVAGVTRLSLLESTTPYEAQYSSVEIAKERLGISTAELALIITSQLKANNEANDKLFKIWGLQAIRTPQKIKDTFSDQLIEKPAFGSDGLLTRVSILLQQSGLIFAEFDRLLESEFINPGALINITEVSSATCSPSEMRLNKTSESELAPFLDRLHRFVRLWRVVGWQIWELDLAMQAEGIGNRNLDDAAVTQTANLRLLKERLRLPIDVLVAMIAGFSDKRYSQLFKNELREITPLYNRLFQNRQFTDPPKQELTFTASLSVMDEPLTALIAASVGLRKTELVFILDSNAIDLPRAILNGTQTAKNELLQQVFRNITLAKALGLSLYDYESAWQLFTSNHFESPATLLNFLNEQEFVKNSGFDWSELGYLLLDSTLNPNATALELTAERADKILTALQDELKQLLPAESAALMLEQRAALVVKHLVLATSLESSLVKGLLENYLYSAETISEPAMQYFTSDLFISSDDLSNTSAFVILERLYKVALLNKKWKSSLSEFAWTTAGIAQTDVFSGLVFNTLQPIEMTSQDAVISWKQSTALFQLAHTSPEMTSLIANYLSAYQSTVIADDKAGEALATLATSFGLSETTLQACVSKLGIADDEYLNPLHFNALINLLSTLHLLGIDDSGLANLVTDTAFDASAELVNKLLKSRLGNSSWQKALRKINDALRLQRRDRLVDFLLAREGLYDSNALYKHYLIDFEISPCMNTTRMLQNTAAVQLFVQRCLFNLEQPKVTPDQIDRKRWEWMQNYRVWEANRKVFLYPENWLFPEVRDDKTETFKAFESRLIGDEPTHRNAEQHLLLHLDRLSEVSDIRAVGAYVHHDINPSVDKKVLYLIGRKIKDPQIIFWRKAEHYLEQNMRWTGWERIEQDISSDHIFPFVIDNHLHLGWVNMVANKEKNATTNVVNLYSMRHMASGWEKPTKSEDVDIENRYPMLSPSYSIQVSVGVSNKVANFYIHTASGRDLTLDTVGTTAAGSVVKTFTQSRTGYHPTDLHISLEISVKLRYEETGREVELNDSQCIIQIAGLQKQESNTSIFYERNSGYILGTYSLNTYPKEFNINPPSALDLSVDVTYLGTTQNVKLEIDDNSQPYGGDRYNAKAQIFFVAQYDPLAQAEEGERLKLKSRGQFTFDGDKWGFSKNLNGYEITPRQQGYAYYQSGELEQSSGNIGYLNYADRSMPGQKLFALPVVHADSLQDLTQAYLIVEGNMQLLMSRRPIWNTPGEAIYLLGYPDARLYKQTGRDNPTETFNLEIQRQPFNSRFDIQNLAVYASSVFPMDPRRLDPEKGQFAQFDLSQPNAIYNWELFYHLPIATATHLSRQHRFEDARRWFHFVFDPTTSDSAQGPQRFWRFLPFRTSQESANTTELLEILAGKPATVSSKQGIQNQVAAWLEDPFNPFAVARLRNSAFEWYTLISYIKNLTDWADQLFRRDTRESINEATLLYIMAAEILGPRPEKIRTCKNDRQSLSYKTLKTLKGELDDFSNVWLSLADSPFFKAWVELLEWLARHGANPQSAWEQLNQLSSIGSLYFNVPPNEKLPELWDMVDDRLFKIRNCQNIEGVRRSLPLYEPPIDPELLIRAKAAGLDLSDVLADRFAPLPHYRFQVLLQKANEFCNEVKSLGNSILSATEKKEAEHLALLRSSQEIDMLKLIESVKQEQIKEAEANIDALNKTRNNALDRFVFLQRQLGKHELTFDANGSPIVEQSLIARVQETGTPDDTRSLSLINNEVDQLWKMQAAHDFAMVSTILKTSSGVAHLAGGAPAPAGPIATALGHALSVAGDSFGMVSSINGYLERRSSIIGGWQRRRDEWVQQSKMTAEEIRQIDKQIVALEIRKSIAEKELDNHRKQIENAQNIDEYMRYMKFSSVSLYGWMESQISGLYFSAYQMAYDLAKKAERAYQFELGEPTSNFIQYGHWDNLRKGLLSGERLSQNLRRMEMAHIERNQRELEITKHISLRQINPFALMNLRENSTCDFNIPEVLFDLDFPGHYFRRIKSVSISVPCVVGPYGSINGTLTLLSSKVRDKAIGDYATDEDSYKASYLPIQSIATSSGQNDSGVFELNFRDERYLPFEGAGVISNWRFALPADFKPFDYDTISDVIFHVRYTARDAREMLATKVSDQLLQSLNALKTDGEAEGLRLLIDLRHDYPDEWARYHQSNTAAIVKIEIGLDRFPFILRSNKPTTSLVKVIPTTTQDTKPELNGRKFTVKDAITTVELKENDFKTRRWIDLRYFISEN